VNVESGEFLEHVMGSDEDINIFEVIVRDRIFASQFSAMRIETGVWPQATARSIILALSAMYTPLSGSDFLRSATSVRSRYAKSRGSSAESMVCIGICRIPVELH
jgi:hypothetical protein